VPEHSEHVSADDLALRALGEELSDAPETHLADCPHCQSELDQLRAVVTTARAVESDDYPSAPPPAVWDRVVAELGLGQDDTVGQAGRAPDASAAAGAGAPVSLPAQRDSRRPAPWLLATAAAVVGVVVGVGATLVATSGDDDEPIVASTELTVLADDTRGGDAEIRRSGSGRVLELDVPTLPTETDGFYEVWLLDKAAKRLVSIGLLDPSQGTRARFPIPDDLDVAEFPVVDVSVEPADGDPAHSGDSVVRGTLSS
jgi:anti-sigma-K factor RskA